MFNPRSLVFALYTHWDTVEVLVRLSREFTVFTSDQALAAIAKVAPQLDAEGQGAVLRSLLNADVLQVLARSSDLQLNAYVLEFVRGLTREHELGLAAVLQARVTAIREATEGLNEGMAAGEMDRVRIAYYGGQLNGHLLHWLAKQSRAAKVVHFPDYDGVGLANFARLYAALGDQCQFWLMPDWPLRLERYGSVQLWRDTLRDFTSISQHLPDQVASLALQMQQTGLALEQESVWLEI